MTKSIRRTVALIAAGCLAVAPGLALAAPTTEATTNVNGRIFNADLRTPADGIEIQAMPEGGQQVVARATTDRQGRFSLPGLATGSYTFVMYDAHGTAVAAAPVDVATPADNLALALPDVRPGEGNAAPAAGGMKAWVSTSAGATVTLLATAVVLALVANDISGDNPSRKDLPPPSQSEP